MSITEKHQVADSVKAKSSWFEFEGILRVFGVEVWHFKFPPEKS